MKKRVKGFICLMTTLFFYNMILKSSDCMSNEIVTLPSSGFTMPMWLLTLLNILIFPCVMYAIADSIVDRISTALIKKKNL